MWWCWGKGTSVICWRITRPTTTECARTLRSTRMLRSIDLRRQSGLSHQSLGSAVSIGITFGWHNRYTQVCRFVDPIADIAVLGSPDNPHADEYKALMEKTTAFSIAGALRNPVNFWVPGRLLSLDGRGWFCCTVRHFGGPLWITHAAEGI